MVIYDRFMESMRMRRSIIVLPALFTVITVAFICVVVLRGPLLIAAAGSGDLFKLRLLLALGADPNAQTSNGATALMIAAWNGDLEMLKALLDAKARVDAKLVSDGETSGQWTSADRATVFKLIDRERDDASAGAAGMISRVGIAGMGPLLMAAQNGRVKIVRALLAAGADVNAGALGSKLSVAGVTPVVVASAFGHLEVVRVLLSSGAAASADGSEALILAVKANHPEIVRALLAADANPNAVSGERVDGGETALTSAAEHGYSASVRALLNAHADVAAVDPNSNLSALEAVIGSHYLPPNDPSRTEIAKLLLDAGADANRIIPPPYEGTPLIMAAQTGDREIARVLLSSGADIHKTVYQGEGGYLLTTDPCPIDRGTALIYAVRWNHADLVKLLLGSGASNERDADFAAHTALMIAACDGNADIVKLLLKTGVAVNQEDSVGMTALSFALKKGNQEITKILRQFGARCYYPVGGSIFVGKSRCAQLSECSSNPLFERQPAQ